MKFMPKSKLKNKYSFSIVTICLVILTGMMFLQVVQLNRSALELKQQSGASFVQETEHQLEQRAGDLAESLSHNVGLPYLAFDMIALYDLMLPVRKAVGVEQVYFYDVDGSILHDGTREINYYGENIHAMYPAVNVDTQHQQILSLPRSIAVTRPVLLKNSLIGGVIVELSKQSYSENLNSMQLRMDQIANHSMRRNLMVLGFISLIIALVSFILAMSAGRRLAEPVTKLREQAERIGLGDYTTTIKVDRDDEIGDLANAFNRMRNNLRAQKDRIEFQLYYDQLSGLRNRRSFQDNMRNVFVSSDKNDKHALLYIDIDDFKRINDALGHAAGDRLLQQFSDALKEWAYEINQEGVFCQNCELGRWGSDQFVVLFSGVTDLKQIKKNAREMLDRISEPYEIAGMEIVLSASVGYALFPDDARDSDAIVSFADLAMYRSKERGQNLVSAYYPQNGIQPHNSLLMESEIRRAFRDKQFELRYSPIISATSRAILGFEQMVYWHHPEKGFLKPRQFMPALISSGMHGDFRLWGYNSGLDHLEKWHQSGHPELNLCLNLVSLDFEPSWLGNAVAEGLERTQIDSRYVQFDISESYFSNNMMLTAEVLNDLRIYGIRVWIDSFGTGYTALNRLRRMPIDGIKLHSSVVKTVNSSKDSQNMVSASIAMAHGLGFLAGADGVKDEQQLGFLRSKNCDTVQGSLVSKPLTLDQIDAYLAEPPPTKPQLILTS